MSALLPKLFTEREKTMNTLEIAELTGSRHDKVRQSAERLAAEHVISLPPLGEVKVNRERREETVSVYTFTGERGRLDSIIVIAQLSPKLTAALVQRWDELEKQNQMLPRHLQLESPAR